MNNGYWGKTLRINLTSSKVTVDVLPEKICRDYLGGAGIGAKYILDEVPMDIDALSEENKIVIATGPINMVNIPGAGRWEICALSPQTQMWGESNGGGFFGSKFKRTGYDVLIVEGKAATPVFIKIEEDKAEICAATAYWGLDSIEASKQIANELGKGFSILAIGQAGENLVPMACVVSDEAHGHAGRTGMGAVMGSKNLKAIAVKGTKVASVANEEKTKELINKVRENMINSAFLPDFKKYGQPGAVVPREAQGLLPIKNFMQGTWREGAAKIGTPGYNDELNVEVRACSFCPMACKRWVKVNDGNEYDHEGPGIEYESLASLGSLLLIDNLKKMSYANDLCNRFGIDTMSVGGVIAMVFELYEKGIIDQAYLDGIKAEWGNADAMIALVKKIGLADGIGKDLGKGSAHLVEVLGEPAKVACVEVRGLEVPAHDPRAYFSMALTYATSSRGACHLHGFSEAMELGVTIPEIGVSESVDRFCEDKKAQAVVAFADLAAIHNSMVWCSVIPFADVPYPMQVQIINAITGWDISPEDFIKIGERINNIQHIINLKRGLTRGKMKYPERLKEPLMDGGTEGKVPDFEKMMDEYLIIRKWDENAIPFKEKLDELGLSNYVV